MAADPTTSEAPAPSRFFTVLGWICIGFGAYVLVTSLINYALIARVLRSAKPEHQLIRYNLNFAVRCLLSALSIASGVGMWKRRSWAPWVMSLAGGATVAAGIWFFAHTLPQQVRMIQETRETHPIAAMDIGLSILAKVFQFVIWLAVLGGLYREEGRREFPASSPPFTPASFFGLASVGALVISLIYFWFMRIGSS